MAVAGIDKSGDWIFGRGFGSYRTKSKEISQNVVTRLRSFTNDWFLDITHGNEWLDIFGSVNNQSRLRLQVSKTIIETEGVVQLKSIEVTNGGDRRAIINATYLDIYNQEININEAI